MVSQSQIEKLFKGYDIRGIMGEELDEEFAYAFGNALAQHKKLKRCVVARDTRNGAPEIAKALIEGLRDAGSDVTYISCVSTAQLRWVAAEHGFDCAVSASASHNPKEYCGIKTYLKGSIPYARINGLWDLKKYVHTPVKKKRGSYEEKDYTEEYLERHYAVLASSDRKLFLDPSGGAACKEAKAFAATGKFNVALFNATEDPEFTLHSPNPREEASQMPARHYCGDHGCIGAIFDGDADRVVLVDEQGQVVEADLLIGWLAQYLLKEGESITAAIGTSLAVKEAVERAGGTLHFCPVGSANTCIAMSENGSRLGAEPSGHVFLPEMHDSESPLLLILYTLKYLGDKRLCDVIKPLRETYKRSALHNYRVTDAKEVLDAAKTHYSGRGEMNLLDGVLSSGQGYWVSIRKSNTEPVVRVQVEADSEQKYNKLLEEAKRFIEPFSEGQETH